MLHFFRGHAIECGDRRRILSDQTKEKGQIFRPDTRRPKHNVMDTLEKPYELSFEVRPEYLFAHVKAATATPEIILAYVREVIERARESGLHRILVEREIPVTLSVGDSFFTGTKLAESAFGRTKMALVDVHSQNTDSLRFGLLTISNRGGNVQFFTNIPDAESWLLTA